MPELKESKSQYISRIYQNIPDELKQLNQWVVHENKIPFDPKTKKAAKSNDVGTWGSFKSAIGAYCDNGYNGIGFCFTVPYVGVDIDKSLDLTIPTTLQSYTEYSPSGKGLHIICKGNVSRSLKTTALEIYNKYRFFTVTGRQLKQFPSTINDCTDLLKQYIPDTKVEAVRNPNNWVVSALNELESGNIHNVTIKIVGKLHRDGWQKDEIRSLLLPHIERVKGDIRSFEQRLDSVSKYPTEQRTNYNEPNSRPIEIFTPSKHLSEYEQSIKSRGKVLHADLSTGFDKLDHYTNGLKKGALWVVGARTGVGKTGLSINFTSNLLDRGKRVLFFSTEMVSSEIFDRLIALKLGLDLFTFGADGWQSGEDEIRYNNLRRDFENSPIHICQEPEPTIGTIGEAISQVVPDVIIIDHIQRIANSSDKRHHEISRFIKGLNTICRRHNIAGIVNSQLNRLAETEVPGLHHLRECGSLEEEAHAVLLLSRIDQKGETLLIDIAKNRGPKGQVEMKFDKKTCQFKEI